MKTIYFKISTLLLINLICFNTIVIAQNPKTPMMGWSSWNTFKIDISEELIEKTADAMVEKGLKDAGYFYVNIDDGFFHGRDANGNLIYNTEKFPNGMRVVADYIHSKGLKAGIYSDGGIHTCAYQYDGDTYGKEAGMRNHEEQDAKLYFDTWDYDFIKLDFCGGVTLGLEEEVQYRKIYEAIQKTNKKEVRFNICRWMFPGTWASEIAGSWRISHDILNTFDTDRGVRGILEKNLYLAAYVSPGHFNDMDMMQIGRNTFSKDQERSHFGLWCIMSSPLMIGCDLRTIPASTLEIITNPEIIALNQDILGLQAELVDRDGKRFTLAKQIEQDQGKVRAVALFNCESAPRVMRINFKDIQLSEKARVRDLWERKDLGEFSGFYETTVPAYGTAMLRIEGESSFDKTEFEAEYAFINNYNEVKIDKNQYSDARFASQFGASGNYILKALGGNNKPDNWAEFRKVYSTNGGKYKFKLFYYSGESRNLTVTVNGKEYPMTDLNSGGAGKRARAFIDEIELQQGYNTIRLSNTEGLAPDIDKFVLLDPNDPGDDDETDVEIDDEIIVNTKFPTISSEDDSDETWYYIQFRNQNGVFHDMGEDTPIETKQKAKGYDEQLWKITETAGNYIIVNKSGRKISFADSRFQTSSTASPVKLNILASNNSTYQNSWEIQRVGQSTCMNQFGGAGMDVQIGEWTRGDNGNPLLFVHAERVLNFLPEMSTAEKETWYYLQFSNTGKVIQDMGINELLATRDPLRDKDGQLWKITGSDGNYQIESKLGNTISFSGDTYKAVESNGVIFQLIYWENENQEPIWEMSRIGQTAKSLGQTGENKIGENAIHNTNNPLDFVLTTNISPNLPSVSTEGNEIWYYMQFNNGKGVITDMGNNENLKTQHLIKDDTNQHWKIVEIDNPTDNFKYRIVNKSGRMIVYSPEQLSYGIYQTTSDPALATAFQLVETTNKTYKPGWELSRNGSSRHISQNSSAGIDRFITEAARNNSRNPFLFIELDQAVPTSILNPADNNHSDTRFKVEDKILKVEGENISKITVYSITGQLLGVNNHSFSFTFPSAGYYLVSVTYDDNSVYNRKVMIQ